MSFAYQVLTGKTQRVSLVKFERARLYMPTIERPEIDDRGYFREEKASHGFYQVSLLGIDRGPVVGVSEDSKIYVKLKRVRINDKAPLFVTSSDPSIMTVTTPTRKISSNAYSKGLDRLFDYEEQELEITGIKGSGGVLPNVAKVEIRYGSNRGPVVGELTVYVFTVFYLNIVPHMVNLSGAEGYSMAYIFDLQEVMKLVQAIWQPCGIKFFVGAPENSAIKSNINQMGKWKSAHPETIYDKVGRHHKDAINIYFVDEIVSDSGALGYAYMPGGKGKRGIVAQTDAVPVNLAVTIAHELGHFLGLEHIDKRKAEHEREDLWSQNRLLMRPIVAALAENCLIAMKDLLDKDHPDINHITDPEWLTVRTQINSKNGPYA